MKEGFILFLILAFMGFTYFVGYGFGKEAGRGEKELACKVGLFSREICIHKQKF